jgi:hypothetical protein
MLANLIKRNYTLHTDHDKVKDFAAKQLIIHVRTTAKMG